MLKILIISLISLSPFFVQAKWGKTGHRVVGEIAQSHLSRKSKKVIKTILGNESLAKASNWADFIRSNPEQYAFTFPWHYINIDDGENYKTVTSEQGDIVRALTLCKNKLQNRTVLSLDSQRFYLRLLIHFVGDIHQPLHVGYARDKGGNTIKLNWFGRATNLHKVWDEDMIDYTKLSYTEYAQALDHFSRKLPLQSTSLDIWVKEGLKFRKVVYGSVSKGDKLAYRYVYDHLKLLEERLLTAGLRLAQLLDELFE